MLVAACVEMHSRRDCAARKSSFSVAHVQCDPTNQGGEDGFGSCVVTGSKHLHLSDRVSLIGEAADQSHWWGARKRPANL